MDRKGTFSQIGESICNIPTEAEKIAIFYKDRQFPVD